MRPTHLEVAVRRPAARGRRCGTCARRTRRRTGWRRTGPGRAPSGQVSAGHPAPARCRSRRARPARPAAGPRRARSTEVPGSGGPTGAAPRAGSTSSVSSPTHEVIVVSVRPYALTSRTPGISSSAARQSSARTASPPTIVSRTGSSTGRRGELGQETAPVGRSQVHDGDAVLAQLAGQLARRPRVVGQHERRAAGQRHSDLLDGGVERQRAELQHPVGRGDPVPVDELAAQVGQRVVRRPRRPWVCRSTRTCR